jgi:hypothetical protein
MAPITLLFIALLLTACQTAQDRQWRDLQTILETTRKG